MIENRPESRGGRREGQVSPNVADIPFPEALELDPRVTVFLPVSLPFPFPFPFLAATIK